MGDRKYLDCRKSGEPLKAKMDKSLNTNRNHLFIKILGESRVGLFCISTVFKMDRTEEGRKQNGSWDRE